MDIVRHMDSRGRIPYFKDALSVRENEDTKTIERIKLMRFDKIRSKVKTKSIFLG